MMKCGPTSRNQVGCPTNRCASDALYSSNRAFTATAAATSDSSAAPCWNIVVAVN